MASNIVFVIACAVFSAVYGMEIEIPKDCESETFCDIKPSNFPQQLFDDHVSKHDKAIIRNKRYEGEPSVQEHRSDQHNCHTRVTIKQPYIVRSNTTTKLVVQSNIFEQWIKQTDCIDDGARCFEDILKPSYTSACTPTYGSIKMYLYDPIKKKFLRESVPFPVCCSCSIKSKV